MNQSKVLRLASKPSWYAHAYSEYLADVATQLSELRSAIEECLDLEAFSINQIEAKIKEHGLNPQARYIVNGNTSVPISTLVAHLWQDCNGDSAVVDSPIPISSEQFCQDLFSEWHHSVISSKAFLSFSKGVEGTLDRVTTFIQDIDVSLGMSNEIRDTVEYYKSMIEQSSSVDDFVTLFTKVTGIDKAEESNAPESYSMSDMTKYTGHTPGVALDFSTVSKAVDSTVSVAATTIKSVFSMAKSGLTWLFNKAKKYVVDTVIDPAIAEYIGDDKDNSGYLDGFAYFGEFTPNAAYSHFGTGAQISDVFYGFANSYAESWIKLELVTGEFIFKIVEDSKWQAYFKPVAIDVQYLVDNCTLPTSVPSYKSSVASESIDNFSEFLGNIVGYIQPVAKDATKDQLIAGYAFAYDLTSAIAHAAFLETYLLVKGVNLSNNTEFGKLYSKWSDYKTGSFDFVKATNLMLINAAAGDPGSNNNLHNYSTFSSVGVSVQNSVAQYAAQTIITDIMSVWALCRLERDNNPTDYTFVPYSNNHSGFTNPSWKVKSDDEIATKRDNFLAAALTAVVVVIAAVFVGAMVTKISTNIEFKRLSKVSALNAKMWNGEKLTFAEKRLYKRYSKRLNASSLLNYGKGNDVVTSATTLQRIIDLIQG